MNTHWLRKSLVLFFSFLGWISFIEADAVTDWNVNSITASGVATAAGRPGPFGAVDLAMVHVAIHDAVQAYEGQFEPYCTHIDNATGSPVAAIAKAAHDVLVSRFPAQAGTLDATYSAYLDANEIPEDDEGVAIGALAAECIIALRTNDGSFPLNPVPFLGGTNPGEWRPTPPAFAAGLIPWLGDVTPFALQSTAQCHVGPPPSLSSGLYARDYNEVKDLGSLNSSVRTLEQTDMANFFADNPTQIWGRLLRGLVNSHLDTLGDSARLFALTYLSNADALICSWDAKFSYAFWRPITAIREGDNDGNPNTIGDSTWTPFLTTPPYPDYTSGQNNLSGSTTRTLKNFFGTDHMEFSLTSNFPPTINKTRNYSKFSDVAEDVVLVRILHGIHFRTADKNARKQGKRVADYVFENYLRPIR